MFDIIYNFIYNNLLTTSIDTATTYNQQLALILSHVSIALIYIVLISFLVWIFKVVSGAFLWK